MSISTHTLWNRLQNNISGMDDWIRENKPIKTKSNEVFAAFLERYGQAITGSAAFVAKTKRVIEKASRLASGITIMQRLLNANVDFLIKEGEEDFQQDSFLSESGNLEKNNLTFSFCGPRLHYLYFDEGQHRKLAKLPRTATFIHECLHLWHAAIDPQAQSERHRGKGVLPEMDNDEEELAITGNVHLKGSVVTDFCCENTALRELSRPLRVNHKGVCWKDAPDLHDLVRFRLYSSIAELVKTGQLHENKKKGLTPLELALHLRLVEKDSELLDEWLRVLRILVENGKVSEHALKLACLENSEDIVSLLLPGIEHPAKEEIFQLATKNVVERFWDVARILQDHGQIASVDLFLSKNVVFCEPPGGFPPGEHPMAKIIDKEERGLAILAEKFPKAMNLKKGLTPSPYVESRIPTQAVAERDVVICTRGANKKGINCPLEIVKIYAEHGYSLFSAPRPFFSDFEVQSLLDSQKACQFRFLSSSIISSLMKNAGMSYETHWELEGVLTKALPAHLENVMASLASWKKTEDKYHPWNCVFSLLSENGTGVLQQIISTLDPKLQVGVDLLKNKEGKPISSLVCETSLREHRFATQCHMYFEHKLLLDGIVDP